MHHHIRSYGRWNVLGVLLALPWLLIACDSGPAPDSGTPIAQATVAPTPNRAATVITAASHHPWWYGLHMLSASDGWAVGKQYNGDGAIMHYKDGQWQQVPAPAKTILHGVWMVSPSDGWAVGERSDDGPSIGAILHYTGGVWATVPITTDIRLFAVQMVAADEGWAVGITGILHYSGGTWTPVAVPTEVPVLMQSLAMISPAEGWIIGKADDGGNDIALHYTGRHWTSQRLDARAAVTGIQMLSPTEGWAAGTFGILHYTGGTWERVERPVAKPLHAIAMISPTEGWIGGSFQNVAPTPALLLHYSGGKWETVDTGVVQGGNQQDSQTPVLGADLYAIQMVSPTEGWAVGALDTIAHLQGGAWARYAPPPTPEVNP